MEMLGLDDELLPFSELGAVVKGLQHGDIERAWPRLQLCHAADLIESEVWPQVPGALLAVLLSRQANEGVRLQCIELHRKIFDEGGADHKARVFINLAQYVAEAQPTLASASTSTAWLATLHLLGTTRAELAAEHQLLMRQSTRDTIAFHACGLATLVASQDGDGRPSVAGVALLLAGVDPTARWAERPSRAAAGAGWHHLLDERPAAAGRRQHRARRAPGLAAADDRPRADGDAHAPPPEGELALAIAAHDACRIVAAAVHDVLSTSVNAAEWRAYASTQLAEGATAWAKSTTQGWAAAVPAGICSRGSPPSYGVSAVRRRRPHPS